MKKNENLLVWFNKQNGFGLALVHSLVRLENGTKVHMSNNTTINMI